MHFFDYKSGVLHAEDINIELLAEAVGTPFYCYSEATVRRHFRVFKSAFKKTSPLIAYSVKANSNLSVLQILCEEGAGADVVSGGELARALEGGFSGDKIVYSGVGKTRTEMAAALCAGIYQFNVESEPEMLALNEVALAKGAIAPIAFRINPDISAGGHEKISTGKAEDKFGVPWGKAREIYRKAASLRGISIKGVDVHIGSQISDLGPFRSAFDRVVDLVRMLRADGHSIERLDLGGGLGIPYGDARDPPHPDDYARLIQEIAGSLGVQLMFEPGRIIVGNAGILVSRVLYVKDGEVRKFLIVDAAMNDLIRPALYGAYHAIKPVRPRSGTEEDFDVVGPVCESGDRFARSRTLSPMRSGDLVAFMSAGAYGAVQSSQYNSRPLAPEILVNGEKFKVIRRRPTYDEMVAAERIAEWAAVKDFE